LVEQHSVELHHRGRLLVVALSVAPAMQVQVLELQVVDQVSECSHASPVDVSVVLAAHLDY
jgi:hypothetical protein